MEAAYVPPARPDKPPGVSPARLVVKPTVYHQLAARQPVQAELPTVVRQLTTDEQPWSRDFTVGTAWQSLRGCWFIEESKPTSLVVLSNREGRFTQTVPTVEERALAQSLTVLVLLAPPREEIKAPRDSFSCEAEHFTVNPHPPLLLVPGGLLVLEPADLKGLRLRCPAGEAKVSVWVFPG